MTGRTSWARDGSPSPWALTSRDEIRERALVAMPYPSEMTVAAERDEQWHAAHLIRRRYRHPQIWLACAGLTDVPPTPDGWCNCNAENGAPT